VAIQDPQPYLYPNFFKNKNGLWIFHRDWLLPRDVQLDKLRGVVIISHGAAEHIQRYEHVAQALNKNGFVVFGIDQQGHGMSEGRRGYVASFEDYLDDFYVYCKRVKSEYSNVPIFALGHSMGGLITTITAHRYPELFNGGVVLSAPFFAPNGGAKPDISNPIIRWGLERISDFLPKLPLVTIDNKGLSSDPLVYYRVKRDPLHLTTLTIRMGSELIHASEEMRKNFDQIEFPFYIFGGKNDPLSDPQFWEAFYQSAKTPKDLKHKYVFDGLLHETLNETEHEQKEVLNKILEWLLMRCDKLDNE